MILFRAATCLLLVFLVCCDSQPPKATSIGEAYVGPTTLNLRRDLSVKSAITGTAKHGDQLEILEYRYRLVRVRSPQGVEGWTDMRQLLSPEQMASLRHMADTAAQYPSQGTASVFDALNMHSEANRVSPSFWQIPENGKVEVLAHKLAPRIQAAPPVSRPVSTRATPRKKKERQAVARIGPPPSPPGPKPPADWLALSVPKADALQPDVPKPEPKPAAPVPMDDWSLVRTSDHRAGWVLTRMLNMAIPDEVAQYAEGHRITSYFALGQTEDEDVTKTTWLWTTINKGLQPYEFDSFRIFVWSRRHHRYETSYIERNVVGHFPVEVKTSGDVPTFTLILESDDGKLLRKTYSFDENRVHLLSKQPYEPPAAEAEPPKLIAKTAPESAAKPESLYSRLRSRVHHLFR